MWRTFVYFGGSMFKIGDKVRVTSPRVNNKGHQGLVFEVDNISISKNSTLVSGMTASNNYYAFYEDELTHYITTQKVAYASAPILPTLTPTVTSTLHSNKFNIGDTVEIQSMISTKYNGQQGTITCLTPKGYLVFVGGSDREYLEASLILVTPISKVSRAAIDYVGKEITLRRDIFPCVQGEKGKILEQVAPGIFKVKFAHESIMVAYNEFDFVHVAKIQAVRKNPCECGGHKLTAPSHSNWCPEHKPFMKAN